MNVEYSAYFLKRITKRVKRNKKLAQKVSDCLKQLQNNWRHPSLRTHKLAGNRYRQYAAWVEGDVRLIFSIEEDTIVLLDILNHDEYRLSARTT